MEFLNQTLHGGAPSHAAAADSSEGFCSKSLRTQRILQLYGCHEANETACSIASIARCGT